MKIPFAPLVLILFVLGCSSTQTASYRYTQKQIAHGDLDFENRLRVNEYVNAFSQENLAKPKSGEDLAVQIDFFTDTLKVGNSTTLAQVAVRTREANPAEKAKKYGISLVLDNSGSMTEDRKFQDSIDAILAMILELEEGTEFALTVFSTDARVVVPPTLIERRSREAIQLAIKNLRPEGGTNIEAGLLLGYKTMAQFSEKSQSRLLLLTDGQSNVGVTDPKELANKAGVRYLEGSRISTIGLGHDVDEKLLRTISEKGRGAYYFAENASALKTLFRKDIESLMVPVAKKVRVVLRSGQNSILKKVYGYEQPITDNSMSLEIGELNSDDWRIFIVELESKGSSASVEAIATFQSNSASTPRTKTTARTINVRSLQKPEINKTVARNAVLFANAMALIEVSKLDKAKKYKEAEEILTIQMTNLKVARSLDQAAELDKEIESLARVKGIVQSKKSSQVENPSDLQLEVLKPPASDLKPLVKSALKIAEKALPGPWSLLITLIGMTLD